MDLEQFTTSGLDDPTKPYWNCVADLDDRRSDWLLLPLCILTTEHFNFPDYPKYGVWTDSYVITTREFGPTVEYGIGVYALEKNKMINGNPRPGRQFFLDGNDPAILPLVGDGLLPADIDGKQKPKKDAAIPLVGTQDDDAPYGATFDALNIWDLSVKWRSTPVASLELAAQLPVARLRLDLPVRADLSRLPAAAGHHQPAPVPGHPVVPATPDLAPGVSQLQGLRVAGHEPVGRGRARRGRRALVRDPASQRGTYSHLPTGHIRSEDGVHRWMGSVARTRRATWRWATASSTASNVFPGHPLHGPARGDPLGQMTLGEGTIINGTGVQTTTNSRWGDYTSMNVDPVDDCTFWYVNEYYTAAGQASSTAGWQTRIAQLQTAGLLTRPRPNPREEVCRRAPPGGIPRLRASGIRASLAG